MKKFSKKSFSMLLALIISLMCLPVVSFASHTTDVTVDISAPLSLMEALDEVTFKAASMTLKPDFRIFMII